MTYHYTYKITLLKGKSLKDHYYYGQHTTDNLDDGYAGSGKMLQNYYKKYGAIENVTYTKNIIAFYSSLEELNQAEYELIGDKYETDEMCLNLKGGGKIGKISEEQKQKISLKLKGKEPANKGAHLSEETKRKIGEAGKGRKHSEEAKQKISESKKGKTPPNKGKHHTEETKQKIRESNLGKHNMSDEDKHKLKERSLGNKYAAGRKHTEEEKQKMRENYVGVRGKHWKLDPITKKRVYY